MKWNLGNIRMYTVPTKKGGGWFSVSGLGFVSSGSAVAVGAWRLGVEDLQVAHLAW